MSKNSVLCNLHTAGKPFTNDWNDYITNNQWFSVTYIILRNLENTNLQTLLEKSVLFNFEIGACLNQHSKPRTLSLIINKKKKKERKEE